VPVLAHLVLSIGLCAGSPTQTTTLHVRLADRVERVYADRTIVVEPKQREYTIRLDSQPGLYRVIADTSSPYCSANGFVYFLPGSERRVSLTLQAQSPIAPYPVYLLVGMMPDSEASYVRPVPVLFDENAQCDELPGAPLPLRATTEYDPGSFYVTLFAESNVRRASQSITLDVQAPAGSHHFVYIPMPYPIPPAQDGWPTIVHVDIPLSLVNSLKPTSPSLMVCPQMRISSSR
jgi:hypothetical protein